MNIIDLLFDVDYYANHLPAGSEGDFEYGDAVQHYIKYGVSRCWPPNEDLHLAESLLYTTLASGENACVIKHSLEQGLSKIAAPLLDECLHGKSYNKLQKVLRSYAKTETDQIEKLLGHPSLLNNLLTKYLSAEKNHAISEDTASYYENSLSNPLFTKDYKSKVQLNNVLSILINYSAYHATNSSHASFIIGAVGNSYTFMEPYLVDSFLVSVKNQHKFSAVVFESFVKLIESGEQKARFSETYGTKVEFIAYGAKLGMYRADSKAVDWFKGMSGGLYLDAIAVTVEHSLYDQKLDLRFIKENIDYLLDKGYALSFKVTHKLVDLYIEGKVKLEVVEKLIENHSHISSVSLKALQAVLFKQVNDFELDNPLVKKAAFIIKRLYQQHAFLEADCLKYFGKFLTSSDVYIQRVVLDLFTALSGKFIVGEIDKKALFGLTTSTHLEIKLLSTNILSKIGAKRVDKDPPGQAISSQIEDAIDEHRAFEERDKKKLQIYVASLVKLGWPESFILKLLKNTGQADVGRFIAVFERLYNYQIPYYLVSREGETLGDILLKSKSSLWLDSINKLYRDNESYYTKSAEVLLEEFQASNGDVELSKYVGHKLYLIKEIGNRFGYEIKVSFGGEPSHVFYKELYVYQDNGVLYYKLLTHEGFITEAINVSLLNKEELEVINGTLSKMHAQSPIFDEIIFRISGYFGKWQKEDFIAWRNKITHVDDNNIAQVIAVLAQAMHVTTFESKHHLRDAQIMAVLSLFKSTHGALVQVATGEGKTQIIAMYAAINVLNGRKVDIIISSSVLAEDGLIEQLSFYNILGISAAHNIVNHSREKPCYLADVLYGSLLYFIGDYLRDISGLIRFNRGFEVAIVDESDSVFIDQARMKVQLSGPIPGFEWLSSHLIHTTGYAGNLLKLSHCKSFPDDCYIGVPLNEQEKKSCEHNFKALNLPPQCDYSYVKLNISYDEFVKKQTVDFITSEVLSEHKPIGDRAIVTPEHLRSFLSTHKEHWAQSLATSLFYYELNNQYIVYNDSGRAIIAPVDKESGVIQVLLTWSDGLRQFLELHYGLELASESVVTTFNSYPGYMQKYNGRIYGVTGTLGESKHISLMKDIYNVSSIYIPQFIHKRITIFPAIIVSTMSEWLADIRDETFKRGWNDSRAVLIIAPTVKSLESIYAYLEEFKYPGNLFSYGVNNNQSAVERILDAGDVIVATNMAGRGTDLKISSEVEHNGGLHLLLVSYSDSIRTLWQAFGRPARKGEFGSAQLLIMSDSSLDDLDRARVAIESEKLLQLQYCESEQIMLRDSLFEQIVQITRQVDSPTGYQIALTYKERPGELTPDTLYLYVGDKDKICIDTQVKDKRYTLEITTILQKLNIDVFRHVLSVLSNSNVKQKSTLNFNGLDLVQFICAYHGYTKNQQMMLRIVMEYEKLWLGDYPYAATNKGAKAASGQYYQKELEFLKRISPDAELSIAKQLKLYELWQKDRKLYNNRYENAQIFERFGTWLRSQMDLFQEVPCNLTEPNWKSKTQQDNAKITKVILDNFEKFGQSIITDAKSQKLIRNPAYLIRKAFAYQGISFNQQIVPSSWFINSALEFRGDYNFASGELKYTSSESYIKSSSWITLDKMLNIAIGIGSATIGAFATMTRAAASYFTGAFDAREVYLDDPLGKAVDFIETAINNEPTYSWAAYNAKSYMKLFKDCIGVTDFEKKDIQKAAEIKNNFMVDASKALGNLNQTIIVIEESKLSAILFYGLGNLESDLVLQSVARIKIFRAIADQIAKNIEFTYAHREDTELAIRPGRILSIYDILADKNVTQEDVRQFFNTSTFNFAESKLPRLNISSYRGVINEIEFSGALIFEIESYELEKDWGDTIFSFVLGIFQIAIGAALMMATGGAGSVFLGLLGEGLVVQGLGDIFSGLMSVVSGMPMDMDNYLRSKGIGLAVTIITAGIGHIANSLKLLEVGVETFNTQFLFTRGFLTVFTGLATQGLSELLGSVYDSNDKAVKLTVDEKVEELLEKHKQQLTLLFAADIVEGVQEREQVLRKRAMVVTDKYAQRFRSSEAQIATGVAGGVIGLLGSGYKRQMLATATSSGINAGLGAIKVVEALEDFEDRFGQEISAQAVNLPNKKQMMTSLLERSWREQGAGMVEVLLQGGVEFEVLSAAECGKIANDNFALGQYVSMRKGIRSVCDQLVSLLKPEAHQGTINVLKTDLSNIVFVSLGGIVKTDLLAPIASGAVSLGMQYVSDKQREYLKEQSKQMEAHVEGVEANAEGARVVSIEHGVGPRVSTEEYTIKKGDTLGEIAKARNSKVSDLLSLNPEITNAHKIEAGKTIKVPSRPANDNSKQYRVQPGDTLSGIAERSGVSKEALLAANPHIKDPNKIYHGTMLNVPTNTASSTPAQPQPDARADLMSFEDFKKAKIEKDIFLALSKDKDINQARLNDYIKAKYALYKSGVPFDKISFSPDGLTAHVLGAKIKEYREKYPNAAANIDQTFEYIYGVLGKVAAEIGKAVIGADGLPIFLNPTTDPELFEYAREMGEVRVQYVVEKVIVPIVEAVDDWSQAMTPQQKIFVDFIDKAIFAVSAGVSAVKVGVSGATKAMPLAQEAFAKIRKPSMDKIVDLAKINRVDVPESLIHANSKDVAKALKIVEIDVEGNAKVIAPLEQKPVTDNHHHKYKDPGDAHNPKVLAFAKDLPTEVPAGRIDYSREFILDLENFEQGSSKLFNGKLKEDLYLVNFHDIDVPLSEGRSIKWATHFEVGRKIPTLDELHQHLALVKPDWGTRTAVTYIKIPKGTDVTMISGKAKWQRSYDTNEYFRGGAYQTRFYNFDPKWITETKPINDIIGKK